MDIILLAVFFFLSVCKDIESLLNLYLVVTCTRDCITLRIWVPCCMSWSSEKESETVDKPW